VRDHLPRPRDARYCSTACRQKCQRGRAVQRAAEKSIAPKELGNAITRARQNRDLARTIRKRAAAARREALQNRRNAAQAQPNVA
jgi:hypothetical protein